MPEQASVLPPVTRGGRAGLLARLVANGFLQAIVAVGMAVVIDRLLASKKKGWLADVTTEQGLWLLLGGTLLTVALKSLERRDAEAFGLAYVHDLRLALFRHVCALPTNSVAPRLGPMMTRLGNDMLAIKNWISYGIASLVVAAVSIVTILGAVAVFSLKLSLAGSGAIVFCLLAAAAVAWPLRRTVRKVRRSRGRLGSLLGEKLLARHSIQVLGRVEHELAVIAERSTELTRLLIRRGWFSGLIRALPNVVLPLSVTIVALGGAAGFKLFQGNSQSTIVLWFFLMGLVAVQMQALVLALDYRINYLPAFERIRRILAMPITGDSSTVIALPIASRLHVLSAWKLEAEAGGAVVTGEISPGELVSLNGGTPAARTRIGLLLARLEEPSGGAIMYDGQPVARLALADYRRHVALVSQDLPLFRGTVGGNLRKAYRGSKSLRDQMITRILSISGLTPSKIAPSTSENGQLGILDLEIDEAGGGLPPLTASRVRFARALAGQPSVLIIDDPLLTGDTELMERVAAYATAAMVAVISTELLHPGTRVWNLESRTLDLKVPTEGTAGE